MFKKFKLTRLLAVGLLAVSLSLLGCGSSSSRSEVPPEDPEVPVIVDPEPTVPQNPAVARTAWAIEPTITILDADVDGGILRVTFEVADQAGNTIPDLSSGFGFTVAQLIPSGTLYGAASQAAQHPYIWQSYVNRVEDASSGANRVGPVDGLPVFERAIQATTDSFNAARLVYDAATEEYTYTYNINLATGPFFPEDPVTHGYTFLGDGALTFRGDNLHRVGIQLNRILPAERAPANATFDFIPATGVEVTPENAIQFNTRYVAETANCNTCHDGRLAIHGGNRIDVDYCVTCHNPGTVDANSGFNLDMANMIHKIHRGANLPSVQAGEEYAIWGFMASKHDYTDLHYPTLYFGMNGEPLNCTTCHAESVTTPDGDNWYVKTSDLACFSCHDAFIEGKTFAYNNGGTYATHTLTSGTFFPDTEVHDQTNLPRRNCGGCHAGAASPNLRRTIVVHDHDFDRPQLRYIIEEVALDGNQPVVTFRIEWRENALGEWTDLDLTGDLPSVTPIGGTEPVALAGSPSFGLVYSMDGVDWGMARPNGQPELLTIASLREAQALQPLGDGSFRAILNDSYPEGATRRAVMLQGYFTFAGQNLDTPSALAHVQNDFPRREVVEESKCLGCHGSIAFHGGNRVDNPMVCASCHNPRLTSSGHTAPGGEPGDEVSNNFKDMIHGIHAGTLVGARNFRGNLSPYDFTDMEYPGVLSNCLACHREGTYEQPAANAAVTTNVTIDRESAALGDDDRVTSPYAASCVGCHNSREARAHIEASGGFVRAPRAEVLRTEGGCVACHGVNSVVAPVSEVHSGLR
jgi:OmcA/MtrC family decaheme c-type cytochrome